jgi:hypothetical protein
VLARAVHKSKREIQEIVAELAPRPDVPSAMRKLPERPAASPVMVAAEVAPVASRPQVPPAPTAPRPVFEPLSPARYKLQLTVGPELRDDLEALRALMRSAIPDGDLAVIVRRAVRELRERLEARRYAQTKSPRRKEKTSELGDDSSRYVPAEFRRDVYRRDGSQCRFVDAQGRRCPERHNVQYHHRDPWARGGRHDPENLRLMCWAHNRYLAELDYGKKKMDQYGRSKRPGSAKKEQSPSLFDKSDEVTKESDVSPEKT